MEILTLCGPMAGTWGTDMERGMYFEVTGMMYGTLRLYPVDVPTHLADEPMIPLFTAVARYNETSTVHTFVDIVNLAYLWYDRYKDRGYGMPHEWEAEFRKQGWI